MPSPGAVWPARVMFGCSMEIFPPAFLPSFLPVRAALKSMMPDTSNTTMRLDWLTASASEPGPSRLRFVTWTTVPPRPPVAHMPAPSAPGNAGVAAKHKGQSTKFKRRTNDQTPTRVSVREWLEARFNLTPALSRGERENRFPAFEEGIRGGWPGGEG